MKITKVSKLLFVFGLAFSALLLTTSCKWLGIGTDIKDEKPVDNVNWNVLFKPGTGNDARNASIDVIRDSVINYYNTNYPGVTPKFNVIYCPCDSLLYNIDIRFIDGMGGSVSSPPPPPPGPGGQGDYVNVMYVANNSVIAERNFDSIPSGQVPFSGNRVNLLTKPINQNAVLAIIDTGIDTTLFSPNINDLIWRNPGIGGTLFNFLPGQQLDNFYDDHNFKHGSAVTALALQAMKSSPEYPRVIVLKALDKDKRGSSFSVSCAMSYAIQNNATLINESLGYYGVVDSVLRHYTLRCNEHLPSPIKIFAAAGNTDEVHHQSNYCNTAFNNNKLTINRLVYPACFNIEFANLICVTSLNKNTISYCHYQNFSDKYVSLGVLNDRICCGFEVKFMNRIYQGSSFATPVASGVMMDCIMRNGFDVGAINNDWNANIVKRTTTGVTIAGNYIISPE